MLEPKLEPCLICDNPECEAHVLATTIEPDKKRFNLKDNLLEFTCPSCDELVCVPIFDIRWLNVANQHVQNDRIRAPNIFSRNIIPPLAARTPTLAALNSFDTGVPRAMFTAI